MVSKPVKIMILVITTVLVIIANNYWLNHMQQPSTSSSSENLRKFEHRWKTKDGEIAAAWNSPWVRLVTPETKDTASEVIQLFRHQSSDSFLLIRVTQDVPKSKLSDEQFLDILKDQILAANSKNRMVDLGKAKILNKEFDRLRFSAFARNVPTQIWEYNRRDGKRSWSLQIIFPSQETPDELPEIYNDLKLELPN